MSELVVAPSNTRVPARPNNLFNNKFILFIPLFIALSGTVKNSPVKGSTFSEILYKLPDLIDFENFGEKIEVLKKIGPYLPESVIGTVNTLIFSLDRINKVIGLMDVVSVNKSQKPIVAVENLTNKERINHVLMTIKEEMPEEKIKNFKPILDVALNFDKYNTLINMMATLSSSPSKYEKQSNQNSQNNKNIQLENMIEAIKPMLGEDADKGMDKVKEMMQMFEILNVLNTPDKEKSDK